MLCDNDELEVHASHKHGVHCKYFQCKSQVFLLCTISHCTSAALWTFGCCLKCLEQGGVGWGSYTMTMEI